MPPTDPRYEALRERFLDILPETDDDPALTRLAHDLDILMQAPVPARLQRMDSANPVSKIMQIEQDDAPTPYITGVPTGTQRQRHSSALIATIAAALIVALLAGALLTRMAGTPSKTGVGHVNYSPAKGACAPGDITAHLPANAGFDALDMVSSDEGWAVGVIVDPAQDPSSVQPLILHYAHCAWTPVSVNYPGAGLSSISMGAPNDGWAVGNTNNDEPFALHYTNGSWQRVSPPPGATVPQTGGDILYKGAYSSVRMLSANEGWIIFNRVKDSNGLGTSGLLHLSHGKWSEVETPFPVAEFVLPVAPDDAWVAGSASNSQEQPVLYHYHAGTWTKAPSGITVYNMRMVSPDDIWAAGQMERGSSRAIGAVLHYDGSQWRQVTVGAHGSPQDVEAFDQGTAWAFTRSAPTATQSETAPPSPPIITSAQYQHDGAWSEVAWPFTNITGIGPIVRVSSDEYWAIGSHRVTDRTPTGNGAYVGAGHDVPVLLYFANGVWHGYGQ